MDIEAHDNGDTDMEHNNLVDADFFGLEEIFQGNNNNEIAIDNHNQEQHQIADSHEDVFLQVIHNIEMIQENDSLHNNFSPISS
jgi:hypothetical protein